MTVMVFWSEGGRPVWRRILAPALRRWGAAADFSAPALAAQHDPPRRLAAERIVVENGKAGKDHQEQAEHHGKRLQTGERQPEPALWRVPFPVQAACSDRRPSLP